MAEVHGDEFTRYATRARPVLHRTALGFTADWHEAEDLVQRTLMALYMRWDGLERRDKIASYAYTVMVRLFISDRRSPRWSNEILSDRPPDAEPAPDVFARLGDRLLLADALDGLPPKQRAAMMLRYWKDYSVEETAEVLDCGSSTVRSQTARALATLRSLLAPAATAEKGNRRDAGLAMPAGG